MIPMYYSSWPERDYLFEVIRLPRVGVPVTLKYGLIWTPVINSQPGDGFLGKAHGYDFTDLDAGAHFRPNGFEEIFKKKVRRRIKALNKLQATK